MNNVLLEQTFHEVAKKFNANTNAFREFLYPKIEDRLNSSKGRNEYKKCVAEFMETRATAMYDTLPCTRIFFGDEDINSFFKAMDLSISTATEAVGKTYYGDEPNFSPKAAKDEFTVAMICVIRYFIMKNMQKETELALIHLAFSGKFYPSLHYRSFPIPPARHVMEYAVNNELSEKFDLISEGSVIGCIRKIGMTWLNTYKNRFRSFKDEDVVYIIQQLYSRIGSFMKNIATVYYDCYNHKDDLYIAYSSDSLEEDDYHLADNDSLKVGKITERTMNFISTNGVDYAICKMCSDENITINEIKSIMEAIIGEPHNAPLMKELISLMVVMYFVQNPKNKDVTNVAFLTYSMAAKPNAKQKEIIRQKEIIEQFLTENSPAYLRRRSRAATKNSYERAIRMYFALMIHNANR